MIRIVRFDNGPGRSVHVSDLDTARRVAKAASLVTTCDVTVLDATIGNGYTETKELYRYTRGVETVLDEPWVRIELPNEKEDEPN